jgi:hypothetical protein
MRRQRRQPNRSSASIGQSLVTATMEYLERMGYHPIRLSNKTVVKHHADGSVRLGKLRASQVGLPDIVVPPRLLHSNVTFALEAKMGAGRLSEAQQVWRDRLQAVGWIYLEIRSIDAVMECFPAMRRRG